MIFLPMNLHVNLILESEIRSSSRVSRKFIVIVVASTVAAILLVSAAFVLFLAHSAEKSLLFAEQERKQLAPVFAAVNDLKKELAVFQDLTNAISTWGQSRLEYPALFTGLQKIVPDNIQLTRMTLNDAFATDAGAPTRTVSIYLQGKAIGENAEDDVAKMEKSLVGNPPFDAVMESAKVKHFEAAKNLQQADLRIFDIECRFKPRRLFVPAKPEPAKPK